MNKLLLTLLLLSGMSASAQDGYNLKLKFTDLKDKKIFLAHYFGKPLPTVYKVDSVTIDKNGVAVLQSKNKIIGGLYLILLEEQAKYFEFLLDNGQGFDMTVTVDKLPSGVTFKNSPDNDRFFQYVSFLTAVSEKHKNLAGQLAQSKSYGDSAAIQEKFNGLSKEVSSFRKDYITQHPKSLLSNIFRALDTAPLPDIRKKDGTPDTDEAYRQYKLHYWDNFPFHDERIVYTPLLGTKLEEYFTRMVMAVPDSFNADADEIIKRSRASKEVFKYTVHWLAGYTQESELMGMDAAFVHLVENYYMKGEAFWLGQGTLQKYIDRARSIAPNVIGNKAPDITMQTMDGKQMTLEGVKAKYTLLVFWSPDCGHCEKEIPRIDSVIKAEGLDKKGIKVIAYNIDRDTVKWKNIIKKNKLDSWTHVYDPERKSDYRKQYDVYGTPSVYLLDEKKIICGKKLDHTNLPLVVKITEEKTASAK